MVRSFVYLGSELDARGGAEMEIKRRIALAGRTFNRMHEKVFKSHDIPLKIKLRVLNACVIPVLLYGAESWSITHTMENKLNSSENRWLRRILRVGYKEHVSNAEVRRPRRRWMDGLESDLKAAGASKHGITRGRQRMTLAEMANDRKIWKDVIEKSLTGYSQRMDT